MANTQDSVRQVPAGHGVRGGCHPRKPTQGSRPTRHTQRAPLRMTLTFDPCGLQHTMPVFSPLAALLAAFLKRATWGLFAAPAPGFLGPVGEKVT